MDEHVATVWVAICVVIFCLPFTPAGVPWNKSFTWSSVNYAPLVTIGVMVAVTLWFLISRASRSRDRSVRLTNPEVEAVPRPPAAGTLTT